MNSDLENTSTVQFLREKLTYSKESGMNLIRLFSPTKYYGWPNKETTWQVSSNDDPTSSPDEEVSKCKKTLDFTDTCLEPVEVVEPLEEESDSEEDLLADLMDFSPEIRKTRSGLVYHAAYAGGAVIVGGLLAGPFGAMLGGIFGSMVGWKNADNYKSLLGAMNNMTDEEKIQLCDKLQKLLNFNTKDALQNYAYKRIQENMVVRVAKTVTKPVFHPVDTFNTVTSPIRHPIQTASAVAAPIFHPIQTTSTIIDYFNPFSSTKSVT